ncbi:MAG: secondary thiamine-phosphate synthase enzyme YjbQ [Calditrichaceae bacterium]
MMIKTKKVGMKTRGFNDIINLTEYAREFVSENSFLEGQLLIFIAGATAAISTIEYEPGLIQDLPEMLDRIAPMNKQYHHDDTWHDGNGYAHLRSALMGPSLIIPVADGKLDLGTWQQIILIDFDNRPRSRSVTFQFTGRKSPGQTR